MKSAKLIIPALALLLGSTAMVGCVQNTPGQRETKVTSINIRGKKNTVYLSERQTLQLEAIVNPSTATNKNVRWESNNHDVAEVDANGLVSFKTTGTVKITCSSVENSSIKDENNIVVKEDISQDMIFSSLLEPFLMDNYGSKTESLDKIENIQTNKNPNRAQFYENEEGTKDSYKVGNQNVFKFNVRGSFVDPDHPEADPREFDNPKLVAKFYEYNDSTHEYDELSEAAAAEVVTVSENARAFTFKDDVKGKFKVKVDADRTYYQVSEHLQPLEFEFEVIDGYNVYNAEDLSVYDNSVKFNAAYGSKESFWDEIKAAKGLSDVDAKGIVLQADITITAENLPSAYFLSEDTVKSYIAADSSDFQDYIDFYKTYDPSFDEVKAKARLVGSLYDRVAIYSRYTNENTDFDFEGNYFKVDASEIRQVSAFWSKIGRPLSEGDKPGAQVSKEGGTEGSHAELFGINVASDNSSPDEQVGWDGCSGGKVNFKNTTFIGNGERSDDNKYIGGLINFKGEGAEFTFTNILTSRTFMSFMSNVRGKNDHSQGKEVSETVMTVDRCKGFDSYNSLVYIYGSKHNTVTNSFMTGAGGGIFLIDEPGANSDGDHYVPEVDCYNVYFENKITGTEPWFLDHSASSYVQQFIKLGSKDVYKTSEEDPGSLGWIGKIAKDAQGKTYVSKDSEGMSYVNCIALDICASAFNTNDKHALQGHFAIHNGAEEYNLDMNKLLADPSKPENVIAAFKYQLTSQPMGIIVETQKGAGCLTQLDLSDGAVVANMAALMDDETFAQACQALEGALPGFTDIMAEQLGGMRFLESYSTTNAANLDPNSAKYIANVFTPLVQSIILDEVTKGVKAGVKQQCIDNGMTEQEAEAYATNYMASEQGQQAVANQYAQAWSAAEQGVGVLQGKITAKALAVRESLCTNDYIGMYLKPGLDVNYIGMVFGME